MPKTEIAPTPPDPNRDNSPTASRDRLLQFLADVTTDIANSGAQRKFDTLTMARAKDAATIYRALMTLEPKAAPLDQKPGESDEEYQARLERSQCRRRRHKKSSAS